MLPPEVVAARRIEWEEQEGLAVILAPKFGGGWFDRLLRRLFGDRKVRIKLDEMGTFVWQRCDGATAVAEIAAALKERFPGDAAKGEERVEIFLNTLRREGWIEYLAPEKSVPGENTPAKDTWTKDTPEKDTAEG